MCGYHQLIRFWW